VRWGSPRWRRTTAACAGVGRLERHRDQGRALALAQVVAGGLAGDGRVAEDAQDVVAQLERLAERQAVAGVAVEDGLLGAGEHRAEVQRLLDRVLGALVAGDPQRALDGAAAAGLLEQVEVLPAHELGAHLGVDPVAGEQPVGGRPLRPSISSDHDRHRSPSRIAAPMPNASGSPGPGLGAVQAREAAVDRPAARAGVAAVHDVVVDERAGLEQLERGRRRDDRLAVLAAAPRKPQ
jgi:hypothetical protein